MSSIIKFKCNFCTQEVATGSINKEHLGMCKNDKKWTNDLKKNIEGPHICFECLAVAFDATNDLNVH